MTKIVTVSIVITVSIKNPKDERAIKDPPSIMTILTPFFFFWKRYSLSIFSTANLYILLPNHPYHKPLPCPKPYLSLCDIARLAKADAFSTISMPNKH